MKIIFQETALFCEYCYSMTFWSHYLRLFAAHLSYVIHHIFNDVQHWFKYILLIQQVKKTFFLMLQVTT